MKVGTPGFVGERLKEARIIRSFTGESLAECIGITRQSISKFELNQSSPQPRVLHQISTILDFPIDYFLLKYEEGLEGITSSSTTFYRSLSTATKFARDKAQVRFLWVRHVYRYLLNFIDFPTVNFPDFSTPADPERISFDFVEDIAEKTRRFWGLGDGPISNVVWLLENNGAVISRYSLESAELDAFSQWLDRPFFTLNSDKDSAPRSRFDLAHELGHIILHRNVPKSLYSHSQHFKLMEAQANRFAGAFLFPQKSFLQEVLIPDLDIFFALKARWKVSMAMMLRRSEDLGLIEKIEAQPLWRSYSRHGYKKREPLDEDIPLEKPRLIGESFKAIVDNRIRNNSEILLNLKIPRKEIEEIAGLEKNFLSDEVAEIYNFTLRTLGTNEPAMKSTTSAKVFKFPVRNHEH
jgi:Zn-dependent peptidase ImmA (M78 family)/transcriptional regulator with XRE-family HTH domain